MKIVWFFGFQNMKIAPDQRSLKVFLLLEVESSIRIWIETNMEE
jgi:hypothetical protein